MFNKNYVFDGSIKAIEPTPVMSTLSLGHLKNDTPSGDDGYRLPTCKSSLLLLPPYSAANPMFASLLHKLAKAKGLLTSKPFDLEAFQRHFA